MILDENGLATGLDGTETTFADLEAVITTYLATVPDVAACSTKMPTAGPWPFVLVTAIPAGGDDYLTSSSTVDVEVFDPDYAKAKAIARRVHYYMRHLRHTAVVVGGNRVPIDNVRTINEFGYLDYGNPNLNRLIAEYAVSSLVNAQPL